MLCALIKDGIVINIVTVNSDDEYREAIKNYDLVIDITDANPTPAAGWTFDGLNLNDPTGQAVPKRKISKLKMLERFTDTEIANIEAFAAQSNPYAYALRGAMRKQSVAAYIDLSLPQTQAGINNLVALGLLTQERANAIIETPITELEQYRGIE